MVLRFFLLLALLWVLAQSKQQVAVQKFDKKNHKIFELMADHVEAKNNIVTASGHAILLNYDVYILADQVVYDTKKKEATLEGHVRVYRGEGLLVQSEHVKIRLDDKYELIFPFYVQDSVTGIWISADIAHADNDKYHIKNLTTSGCSIDNPIWHVRASSGHFNATKSHLSLWNSKIFLGNIPVLYLPYVFVSTSTKRASGLLYPEFGTSNLAGFIYLQPVYVAPKDSWDMTFTPQIRSKRGLGINFQARVINSHQDKFLFNMRYFYNYDKYTKLYDLRNQNVFGFETMNASRQTLQKYFKLHHPLDNAFYLDFLYMNDLDYVRFEKVNKRITDATHMSRGNYYVQTNNHFYGFYLKYFLNLNKINNNTTFQSLPNLQYHKYLAPLGWKHLLYSLDYQFNNIVRQVGYGYVQNSISVPLGMQFSLFKKYLSVGIWNSVSAGNVAIMNTKHSYVPNIEGVSREFGNYFSSSYALYLNTDLAREYNKFLHTIQLQAILSGAYYTYTDGLFNNQMYVMSAQASNNFVATASGHTLSDYDYRGQIYDAVWNPSSIVVRNPSSKQLYLNLTQYLYGLGGQELLYWRISQSLDFDDQISIARTPMETKIGFSPLKGLDIYGTLFYSWYYNSIDEVSINANYTRKFLSANISYYVKKNFNDNGINKIVQNTSNYLKAGLSNDFRWFALNASVGYDIENNVILNWRVGLFKKIRCFGVGLEFVNQRRPVLTSNPNDPLRVYENNYIKLTLDFSPITKTNITYRQLKR
ncbi:outer membrane protein Imp, required for envelope biogenesis / Organic solvent tolerance protein precursor [Helicobacter bizzozeronii CIII-1]|uniref:Outer membrane protein Imp, required for envelope biogenesis / Organic solvent tolerance protein n=1 Tax=Helicobacter bizzozeronii (strain CIII-1) TaxID=1002804 RepID=F8KP48_HELBC|nr:LPS-assembly protein LptD [Helicobacter bizzozeronii]CCB80553.1 outer membrane protein Imp, required for envelope biogenesis / Organic solvent tolerance protein precursor [Helicobacter bizzozeronii CIII-1]